MPVLMEMATKRASSTETAWPAWMIRFFSTRSASTPPNRPNTRAGTAAGAVTTPRSVGDSVSW